MFTPIEFQSFACKALLGTLLCALPASGQETANSFAAAKQINSANNLVRQGEFEKAIEKYKQVVPTTADQDELNYNQAVAQYRQGDIDSAQTMFTESASSNDASIAASSRYNLGNCLYTQALKTAEQDKPAAIAQLREAISHYRDSLRLNRNKADARANIELAAELIRKLAEEQKQEEQNQNPQQQTQQNQQGQQSKDQQQQDPSSQSEKSESEKADSQQDQSQQQSDSQQSAESRQSNSEKSNGPDSKVNQDQPQKQPVQSDPSEAGKGAQEKDSGSKNSQQTLNEEGESAPAERQDNQSQDQPSVSEQAKDQQSSQSEQDSDQPPETPSEQKPQPSPNNQSPIVDPQSAQNATGESNAGEPSTEENAQPNDQPIPSGQLTSASELDEAGKPTVSVAGADPNANHSLMTQEEAMKMLQAVRDRDMLRRLRQEQIERSRHVPVDQDW